MRGPSVSTEHASHRSLPLVGRGDHAKAWWVGGEVGIAPTAIAAPLPLPRVPTPRRFCYVALSGPVAQQDRAQDS